MHGLHSIEHLLVIDTTQFQHLIPPSEELKFVIRTTQARVK
jgi:hypothetical protein